MFCFEQKTRNFWKKNPKLFILFPPFWIRCSMGQRHLPIISLSSDPSSLTNAMDVALLSTAQALIEKDVKMSL